MKRLELISHVKEGRLLKKHSGMIASFLKSNEGKAVSITIERHKAKRTLQQNKLWWLYVTMISSDIGYDKNEMHEILKMKFLKREKVDEKTGEVFEYLGSTTDLNKEDFGELVNNMVRWAADTFGISLPLPGEQMLINE